MHTLLLAEILNHKAFVGHDGVTGIQQLHDLAGGSDLPVRQRATVKRRQERDGATWRDPHKRFQGVSILVAGPRDSLRVWVSRHLDRKLSAVDDHSSWRV